MSVARDASKLVRFERTTLTVPCFEADKLPGSSVCAHCNDLWNAGIDDQSYFQLDKDSMLHAAAQYAPGAGNNLFRLPAMKAADDIYSEQISLIKEIFDGSQSELSADWPGCAFKDVVQSVFIDSGIVVPESGKKAMKRPAVQQQRLGQFAQELIPLWLRVRSFVGLHQELLSRTAELAASAKEIADAATATLQKRLPRDPALTGAIAIADIMMAGFEHAAKAFDIAVAQAVGDPGKSTDLPELSWGDAIPVFSTWAQTVPAVARPPRRTLPKSSSGATPADVPSPAKPKFYAVAVGRAPGVYSCMAEVRKQTANLPRELGKMKVFDNLKEAEDYVRRFRKVVADPAPASGSPASTPTSTARRMRWYVVVGDRKSVV